MTPPSARCTWTPGRSPGPEKWTLRQRRSSGTGLIRRTWIGGPSASCGRGNLGTPGRSDSLALTYAERCALCRLRHQELLDAAHITPDSDAEGEPIVSNGVALCKLHHAAFDRFFFAIRPDYVIEVRPSVLAESDGPMLVVGLQQIHGQPIHLPRRSIDLPDRARLERRYEQFRQVAG